MDSPITRVTLANGLLVLLREIHTAPIISQWLWYRVGSRNEKAGKTGLSHWVEHMQFRGTPQFPAGVLDKAIARNGGVWNAFTNLDWTVYYESLPADRIDLALELEADRMLNSNFNPEDIEAERSIIITERMGEENEPTFRLAEAVQELAFGVHPYKYEIIGDLADLKTIDRQDLIEHYHRYYRPSNAVLALAGDFQTGRMLDRLAELYGKNAEQALQPPSIPVEPVQAAEQRVTVSGPGETTYLQVSYRAPSAADPDFLPLAVLDSLLTGPSDFSIFGGGLSNKTSRLYRALVETEAAVSVSGGLQATIDPYLYTISAILHPDRQAGDLLASLDEAIYAAQAAPPSEPDLTRAVKQARALFVYSSESITHQAAWMGFTEMFADQRWLEGYLERLAEVTPAQVQTVAQKYLRPQNCILGVYLPDGSET